jgi:predicted acylesterase/phospholipase RssA
MDLSNWDIDFSIPSQPTLDSFTKADALVLSGGGMKGLYILGAIEYLYTEVGLDHITSYYGTSIGAVISVLLVAGYTPVEIMAQICVKKIAQQISTIDKHIMERRSLFNPAHFLRLLEELLSAKLGKVPTLLEFYELTKMDIYITTVCLSTPYCPIYLNHRTHPDVPVSVAVHMSISIPFALGYAEYEGKRYMDGGMLDNFPILYASKRAAQPFGICIKAEIEQFDAGSFLSEVLYVVTLPISYLTELSKQNCPPHASFVELETGESVMGFVSFSRQNDSIYEMFSKGYHLCKKVLTTKE